MPEVLLRKVKLVRAKGKAEEVISAQANSSRWVETFSLAKHLSCHSQRGYDCGFPGVVRPDEDRWLGETQVVSMKSSEVMEAKAL